MNALREAFNWARELWVIFLVAITVALVSTIVSSAFDHVHQVDAETLTGNQYTATPAANQTQILAFKNWGVQLTLPLSAALPLTTYYTDATSSVGLSAADIEKIGPACQSSQNALGAIIRLPHGAFANSPKGQTLELFIGTVGAYDFIYQTPQGDCGDTPEGSAMINRETSVIQSTLSALTQTQ